MPFDPNYPPLNAEIESAPLRGQFNGLKSLIDAIVTLTAAQIDGVTTVNAGDPATVGLTVSGDTLHFTFGIPQGEVGGNGPVGPQGPPFANAVADPVTTLAAGTPATVDVTLSGSDVHFAFGIPTGPTGGAGPPGEVTNAALAAAISGTSASSNSVATMDTAFANDPPTLADLELMRAKMNELITALRR